MSTDGKQLEDLVAFVEQMLLPKGFEVITRQRVFNEEGVQIAEFDIEIRGKVGTATIDWLIECRDRPASGPAPGSWIEQLVGRRTRFVFNKVTAVSTSGFAPGAIEFAKQQGIELRQVDSLSSDAFSDWLRIQHMRQIEPRATLEHVKLHAAEQPGQVDAVRRAIAEADGDSKILRSVKTNDRSAPTGAFLWVVDSEKLFDDIEPNGDAKQVHLHVEYTNDDDHFVIDTDAGPVRINAIEFVGKLYVVESFIPLDVTAQYSSTETGEVISQLASVQTQSIDGKRVLFEMHHISDTGETHFLLRNLSGDAKPKNSM